MKIESVRPPQILKLLSAISTVEVAKRVLFLDACEIFAGLAPALENTLAEKARVKRFARGDVLFMQGEPFARFAIITAGYVKLTHVDAQGNEVIYCLRGPHDTLDLPAGLHFANRTCTAQAMTACKTLMWTQSAMMALLMTTPVLHSNIGSILNHQLVDLQERYHELSGDKVERRLACLLARLAFQIGTETRAGTKVNISRQELAQMSGTTIFSVSRIISRWGDLGFVVPCREAVIIANPVQLERVSAGESESRSTPRRPLVIKSLPIYAGVLLPVLTGQSSAIAVV